MDCTRQNTLSLLLQRRNMRVVTVLCPLFNTCQIQYICMVRLLISERHFHWPISPPTLSSVPLHWFAIGILFVSNVILLKGLCSTLYYLIHQWNSSNVIFYPWVGLDVFHLCIFKLTVSYMNSVSPFNSINRKLIHVV